jgi:hypothetical protein
MFVESALTMLPALVWVLLQVLRESEARQRLVDAGVTPGAAGRAVRYASIYLALRVRSFEN